MESEDNLNETDKFDETNVTGLSRTQLLTTISPNKLAKCDPISMRHYMELGFSKNKFCQSLGISSETYIKCTRIYQIGQRIMREEDKKTIWEQYLYEKKTVSEIAGMVHLTEWTVLTVLEELTRDIIQTPENYNIEIPEKVFLTYDSLKKALLEDKKTVKELAQELGMSPRILNSKLYNFGLSDRASDKIEYPFINDNGYRVIKFENRGVLEHKHVWEQHNGPIPNGMHIHHINFDKLDNRIENLDMLSREDHIELHTQVKKKAKAMALSMNVHLEVLKKLKLDPNHKEIYIKAKEEKERKKKISDAYTNKFMYEQQIEYITEQYRLGKISEEQYNNKISSTKIYYDIEEKGEI